MVKALAAGTETALRIIDFEISEWIWKRYSRSDRANGGRPKIPTLFRRLGCEKVAPTGQFEAGGRVPVTLASMTDGLSTLYRDLLGGSYATSDVHVLCRDAGLPGYEHVEVGDIDEFAAALDRLVHREQSRPLSNRPRVNSRGANE
jgi:hypothetical protein